MWSVTKRKVIWTYHRKDRHLILPCKNTYSTIGPVCSGSTALDVSHMQDGDFAGLCLLQKNYGTVGVRISGGNKSIVMINAGSGKPEEMQSLPLTQNVVYFKAECDFRNKKDSADFYYSLNGKEWTPIGTPLKMTYSLAHFMGYRFGLFNYATKNVGGYVDYDFFRIDSSITKNN